MSTWQSEILKEILNNDSHLIIVADPDGLLSDENIQQELKEQQFELLTFEDPIVFRYRYELLYRSKRDTGQYADKRILLRVLDRELNVLPFDILQAGYKITLNLGEVFPNLSYPVLEELPVEYLDKLYQSYHHFKPAPLGNNETCDFILRNIFQISVDLIKAPEDLLRTLLRIHLESKPLPPVLIDRLLNIIERQDTFTDWPLKTLLCEKDNFFKFLQERWPIFINHISGENTLSHEKKDITYGLKVEGPELLPLEDIDVRGYIDDLFLEGILQPIKHTRAGKLIKMHKWAKAGLITGDHYEDLDNLEIFVDNMKGTGFSGEARFQDWLNFASKWAHLNKIRFSIPGLAGTEIEQQILVYQQDMDLAFNKWLHQRYATLYNLPSTFPIMQHHISRGLIEPCVGQKNRVALVVIDGMSYDQWLVIKSVLKQNNVQYKFNESALFAWAPTITSISRQAIFSGKIPFEFSSSIMTTEKEPYLWSQFWQQQGLSKDASSYIKGLGDNDSLPALEELASITKIKALGIVVDKLDKIMHGMELGATGMQSQVKHWAIQGFMQNLLDILRKNDFQVYITADHGNIEASGCGRPKEGLIADLKGERVRIYTDSTLRTNVSRKFPGSIEWQAIGLPDTFLPLIAPNRTAFIAKGHSIVTHGGVCIEELIVPLVHIDWRKG